MSKNKGLPNKLSRQHLIDSSPVLVVAQLVHEDTANEIATSDINPQLDSGHVSLLVCLFAVLSILVFVALWICACFAVVLQGTTMLRVLE